MTSRDRRLLNDYPHFLVQRWGGRLPTPPEYRGTPVAKQGESGKIGGTKLVGEDRYADTPEARAALVDYVRRHQDVDVYYVASRQSPRRAVRGELFRPDFIRNGVTR